jgi:circadian clock protein KaiC
MENNLHTTTPQNIEQNTNSLLKSPTGIIGFDEITFGGLPKNRPTLLVGTIGTGKTFMAMEFIISGITKFGESGVFMTFEERTDELIENVASLGYELNKLIQEDKIYLEHLSIAHTEIQDSDKFNIDGLFIRLQHAITKVNAKRVVLDAMDTLFASLDVQVLRSEYKRLFSWLKEKQVTAIITAEMGTEFLTRMGLEEHVADCVIELNNRVANQISTRRIRIVKYRGSHHANNEYPFLIEKTGMNVYPIISMGIDQNISTTYVSSGIKELDDMLDKKGFFVGSSILVSGSAGTGKTSVMTSFAESICNQGETCLFCAFEEAPNQIMRNMLSIGINLKPQIENNKLHFYYARPTLQNLELHFMAIKETITKIKPKFLILDPVTNLMTEGPNSDVRSMLTRFIDYIKTQQITVMFTAAITIGSIALNPSDEGISSMVDTWIMVEDIELEGERNRSLYVMKSRGLNHSKEIREFVITNQGIDLLPIERNEKGIIIGSKRVNAGIEKVLITNNNHNQ